MADYNNPESVKEVVLSRLKFFHDTFKGDYFPIQYIQYETTEFALRTQKSVGTDITDKQDREIRRAFSGENLTNLLEGQLSSFVETIIVQLGGRIKAYRLKSPASESIQTQ